MRTVSHQGLQLSPGQRRAQAFQQQARNAFLNPILQKQVDESLARSAEYYERENRRFFFDRYETERLMAQLRKVSAPCCSECLYGFNEPVED